MATEPLTNEAIAITEKKVDMALDDIIKMTKNNTNKGKKQWRASNKGQKFNGAAKDKTLKASRYMDSRSAVRQGAFAKRRSNYQGIQFPVTTDVARKAAAAATAARPGPRGRPLNASRMANMNRSRIVTPPVPSRVPLAGFTAKVPQQREKIDQKHQVNGAPRQRPQTLDSLFANMKEERMRRFSQQKSNAYARTNIMGGRPRVPWARGRFTN